MDAKLITKQAENGKIPINTVHLRSTLNTIDHFIVKIHLCVTTFTRSVIHLKTHVNQSFIKTVSLLSILNKPLPNHTPPCIVSRLIA
jgi:hypothetical protein